MTGSPPAGDADPVAVAHAIALRRLSAAPQTRHQLAEALRRRGVPAAAADQVLDRLEAVALVDDEAFAAAWVQSRHRSRGLARRALAAELRTRGVQADTVDAAVAGLEPADELATARALVAARAARNSGRALVEPAVQGRRLLGLLARKGYPPGLAARVVREHLAAAGADAAAAADLPAPHGLPDELTDPS